MLTPLFQIHKPCHHSALVSLYALCGLYALHMYLCAAKPTENQFFLNKVDMKLDMLLTQNKHYILPIWSKIVFRPPSLFNWPIWITFFDMGQYDIFLVDSHFVPFPLLYNGLLVEGRLVHNFQTSPRVKMCFKLLIFQTIVLHKIKFEKSRKSFLLWQVCFFDKVCGTEWKRWPIKAYL